MSQSKTTKDHEEIRRWAEKRGAVPAEATSTETQAEPGILRFMFRDAPHRNDSDLKEISWEAFFEKFDESGLQMLYQETTAEGAESHFNKLVRPEVESGRDYSNSRGRPYTSSHPEGVDRDRDRGIQPGKSQAE